jgi:hypothetical protein
VVPPVAVILNLGGAGRGVVWFWKGCGNRGSMQREEQARQVWWKFAIFCETEKVFKMRKVWYLQFMCGCDEL